MRSRGGAIRRLPPMDSLEAGARRICASLRAAGHTAYLAGGCVRDRLLGMTPQDYDIATSAPPEAVQALFPNHVAVGAHFGVILVRLPEGKYEIATFRQDGPYRDGRHPESVSFTDAAHDAQRRDFTINALFYDTVTESVIDYVGGQADLRAGIIRCVGVAERRFEEDHLRMLRAVRFAARFGYAIEEGTFHALLALAPQIHHTSAERIRDELVMMLCEGRARRAFELLDASGLLREILPEVSAMKGVAQPPEYHPEGDVFIHTLLLLEQLRAPTATLAMGALLHDVGKPSTQTFEDRIRFTHHDKVGARMAEAICRRLRFSNEQTERIVWLVAQHMRLSAIPDMREAKRRRFVREEGFEELLQLCEMDCLASHRDTSIVEWVRSYREALTPEAVRPKPLLSGHDLIALGYAPGPRFREMLTALEDAQLEGRIASREAAITLLRTDFPPPGVSSDSANVGGPV